MTQGDRVCRAQYLDPARGHFRWPGWRLTTTPAMGPCVVAIRAFAALLASVVACGSPSEPVRLGKLLAVNTSASSAVAAPPSAAPVVQASPKYRSLPADMAIVPDGQRLMRLTPDPATGRYDGHLVRVRAFAMDRTEVTVSDFMACVTTSHVLGPSCTIENATTYAESVRRIIL
jgi:formylglycine-generating enzyme required for sulfatase activity